MKTWIAAALMVAGLTVMLPETASLAATILVCFVKIIFIFAGGCLLIHDQEEKHGL